LVDGQLTEVRRFMDWRRIHKSKLPAALPLAALR
jgi:hypothetical protein